ncbi:hypothetical protein C8K63_108173 [Pseudomonas sp. GV085]|nr:hypothetical protein C8K63_108173 [Pseudomonas sp. GV085]
MKTLVTAAAGLWVSDEGPGRVVAWSRTYD